MSNCRLGKFWSLSWRKFWPLLVIIKVAKINHFYVFKYLTFSEICSGDFWATFSSIHLVTLWQVHNLKEKQNILSNIYCLCVVKDKNWVCYSIVLGRRLFLQVPTRNPGKWTSWRRLSTRRRPRSRPTLAGPGMTTRVTNPFPELKVWIFNFTLIRHHLQNFKQLKTIFIIVESRASDL